jgi:PPOX class probable FMN-dependent enzyme
MKATSDRFAQFENVLDSVDSVESILGQPSGAAIAKVIDEIDDVCRGIIAKSPFVLIASADRSGRLDVSPKGDPAGFVRILDDKRLAIPDRLGNRRADTFGNVIENPHVALLFIIPGKKETLRISGEARIVGDTALRESMAVNGRVPKLALVVYVEEIMIHCPKCMQRSKLWEPEHWPDHSDTASVSEAVVRHAELDVTPEEFDRHARESGMRELY